jgi:hypothetical protein
MTINRNPDSSNRCKGKAHTGGQCKNEAAEGYDYCTYHGGRNNRQIEMNNYLSEQFERRLKIEADAVDEIKLLRENLMNLNAVIAARTNLMKDEASMLAHSPVISELIMKAEKVTVSLNKLALESGALLAKPALFTWGQEIVKVVADTIQNKYIGWEDDLIALSNNVATIIIKAQNIEGKK